MNTAYRVDRGAPSPSRVNFGGQAHHKDLFLRVEAEMKAGKKSYSAFSLPQAES
jgi:hypothetical protein